SFAVGASGIIVSPGAAAESGNVGLLAEQIRIAKQLLDGLGYPAEAISIIEPDSGPVNLSALIPRVENPPKSAEYITELPKRDLARWAVQHLAARNGVGEGVISLPAGVPFGEVTLENENCTLCMACASLCPAEALFPAGNSAPGLLFRESSCIQCGLCAAGCPENALSLNPEFHLRAIQSQTPVYLKQEEPFACIRCGRPFAPPAMIAAILSRLSGHWMFGTETERRRLQMCRTCRIKDMYENKEESGLK
ncbi:MAG: 4Fe-4S binding protein, partial [Thermodesulfobacteriota bacterium]